MESVLNKTIKSWFGKNAPKVELMTPPDPKFGHLSTNIAMILAKSKKSNPVELAHQLVADFYQKMDTDIVEKVEVINPGFINFFLKRNFLLKQVEKINYDLEFSNYLGTYGKDKTVVIDYSAPNIAKPFGIGHLRSTNIGQAIYNLYKILGWNCIGDNHLGDWGTQFGKLIVAINKWSTKPADQLTIEDLEKLYVKFHKEAENDATLVDQARVVFNQLEKGDSDIKKMWQLCVDVSLKEFDRVYELLGVKIDYAHGEAFYQDMLDKIIKAFTGKKLTQTSQKATIVKLKGLPPAMLVKSDGSTTYFTRDLATVKYRLDTWKPDLIVYEVGADQTLHFQQVFAACQKIGWVPKLGFVHVAHGLIRWPDGKFSTRSGDTIHLKDVIEEAITRAKKLTGSSQVTKSLTPPERNQMIQDVAIGAVKFSDLAQNPQKDIIFDWDKVMTLSGDSGPYLQYTYARCLSVLDKSRIKETKNISPESIIGNITSQESELLNSLFQLESKILESASATNPSVLAQYLLKLAKNYNTFYGGQKIIGSVNETLGIFLTQSTASVLHLGLTLLGLVPIEKM